MPGDRPPIVKGVAKRLSTPTLVLVVGVYFLSKVFFIDQTDALFHNEILEARSIEALLDLGHVLQAGFLPPVFIVAQTCQASADGCTRIGNDLCHFRLHLVPQINALPQLLPVTYMPLAPLLLNKWYFILSTTFCFVPLR
jgi:hypothetical protein